MLIQIIAVGTKMPDWVEQGSQSFVQRMNADVKLEFVQISPGKRTKSSNLPAIIEDEGKRCLHKVAKGNKVIALEVKGKAWTTPQLAKEMRQWQMDGRNISLLIGGPEGLSNECRQIAEQQWSLSPLTLPHPLVRVIVAEALYRAWSLNNNHPYHRE